MLFQDVSSVQLGQLVATPTVQANLNQFFNDVFRNYLEVMKYVNAMEQPANSTDKETGEVLLKH